MNKRENLIPLYGVDGVIYDYISKKELITYMTEGYSITRFEMTNKINAGEWYEL